MARKIPEALKALKDGLRGRPIRCNKKTLEVRNGKGYAEVMFLGDVHLGSPQCDEARFERMIDYCLSKQLYVFLMGDLIENANRHSIGAGVYEQLEIAQSQHERMVEYLRPLADDGLILGSLSGNHEDRTYHLSGVNVAKALCRELSISFLGTACWNYWRVGKQPYSLYTLHGRTGARFDGTALLALERLAVSFNADLVAMGHAHKCISSSVISQRIVGRLVKEFKKHLLITGHYLTYDGGYGQTIGLPITKMGSPKVKFCADRRDIHVSW